MIENYNNINLINDYEVHDLITNASNAIIINQNYFIIDEKYYFSSHKINLSVIKNWMMNNQKIKQMDSIQAIFIECRIYYVDEKYIFFSEFKKSDLFNYVVRKNRESISKIPMVGCRDILLDMFEKNSFFNVYNKMTRVFKYKDFSNLKIPITKIYKNFIICENMIIEISDKIPIDIAEKYSYNPPKIKLREDDKSEFTYLGDGFILFNDILLRHVNDYLKGDVDARRNLIFYDNLNLI